MNSLRQVLNDYLAMRRALGFKLEDTEWLLAQFLTYLEDSGEDRVTTEAALAWATLPKGVDRNWWSRRLSVVRGFAVHLHALDPTNEVPATDLLPGRRCRATPYLYSDEEISALMEAAAMLCTPHRVATYRTLIGLLAVTGIRVGEAIRLDRDDYDESNGLLIVRNGKFGKSRALPLHPSTRDAVHEYLNRHDRPRAPASTPALLVSSKGTRLIYSNVGWMFRRFVHRVGIKPRSASCRPRLHDFRHSFAVRTVLDGYREEGDTESRLALLSTYLGHVDPAHTYWYLSAAPELLELAAGRLEVYLGGES